MSRLKALLTKYGKALVPAAIAVVTAAQAPLTDHQISTQEVIAFLIAVNATFSVYVVPVLHYRYAKTTVGVFNAVLMALATAVIGGIDWHDATQLVLAALMALGVKVADAESVGRPVDGEIVDSPVTAL
ncbi:hypothetical protein [Actinoplanes derwentensis]|uniref:Holin n=1 Tax=Actinoplanes derwentensis TaxID=113562 RepID=A0A1H2CWL2_9ACTN|nr:hypothetical protein [Actinoplanes derwentensis]GID82032.1 hypothetical protein Ade03nite_09560 [Actinoplanes derwentensis]SDT74416.1 hypothetical protein SAMN04489716_6975 [Actinoplanes derwentensis]